MRITSFFGALIASTALAACGDSGESGSDATEPMDSDTTATEMSAEDGAPAETMSEDMDGGDMESGAMDSGDMESGDADAMEGGDAEPMDEPAGEEAEPAGDDAGADAASGGEFMVAGLTGDPEAGRRVFARCRSCHVLDEGVNRTGPSLYGIFGREAGTVEGFRYSDANANSGITWTDEVMFEYLENPREYIPGTFMAFPGLRSEQDRADVIAYIKANGGDA